MLVELEASKGRSCAHNLVFEDESWDPKMAQLDKLIVCHCLKGRQDLILGSSLVLRTFDEKKVAHETVIALDYENFAEISVLGVESHYG